MSATTKTPVSEERKRIKLKGSPFEGVFRPPNFEELARCYAFEDGGDRMEKLYESCVLEAPAKIRKAAMRSFGIQLMSLAGDDLEAEELDEHGLSDPAAEALEKCRSSNPALEFTNLSICDREFVLRAPQESVIESFMKKSAKSRDLNNDLRMVRDHCIFGDLDYLLRERPAGICAITKRLAQLAGVALEAEVEKL